jgi:hypothetical protein
MEIKTFTSRRWDVTISSKDLMKRLDEQIASSKNCVEGLPQGGRSRVYATLENLCADSRGLLAGNWCERQEDVCDQTRRFVQDRSDFKNMTQVQQNCDGLPANLTHFKVEFK